MKTRAVIMTIVSLGLVFLACQTRSPSADVLALPSPTAQAQNASPTARALNPSPTVLAQDRDPSPLSQDPSPPDQTVKLVFIHHSCGDAWLESGDGDLGNQLGANNYYVSDTYYEWGPDEIGSYTDIGNWWDWFRGSNSATYTQAVYDTTNQHATYTRPMADPGGENEIIMFKSCYPNSHLGGSPSDPPTTGTNPLRGEDYTSPHHTVGNAKGIYNDILEYFSTRQDKLFVVITAPPLVASDTDATHAANARAFNTWLVNDWLDGYAHNNVAVFGFYNVLTSNGGSWDSNDLGWETGNHHRYRNGTIEYVTDQGEDTAAYPDGGSDSHPAPAGNQKATGEFLPLLNIFYNHWKSGTAPARPNLTLTTPTGGTSWPVDSQRNIQWTTTPAGSVAQVNVYYSIEGVTTTLASAIANNGVYAWTTPPTPSTSVRVRVESVISPTTVYDVSGDFTLFDPSTFADFVYVPLATNNHGTSSPPPIGECPAYDPSFTPVSGTEVYAVPDLDEPSPRQWFTDPTFNTCLVRMTDRGSDLSAGDPSTGLVNEYARVQSFNADETRLLGRGTDGTWYLYDAQTLGPPLAELPLVVEPRWDAQDPNLIYYSDETRLKSYHVGTAQHTVVHEFADDFPGQSLSAVWMRHEGRPSRDTRYWGLMAQDQDWETIAFLVYDRVSDQVTIRDMRGVAAVADGIDHVTISPLGTYFLASFDRDCASGSLGSDADPCGLMVYDSDLSNGRGLLRTIGHYDPALDKQGGEVVLYQDNDTDHISLLDLDTGVVTPLWEIDFSHTAIGLHFSGLAYDRPGWGVVSTHDNDLTTYTWMDDQVFAVELKAGGRVVRLAHTHSLVDDEVELDYWAEPHASVNRDLTRILFTTDWGRSGTGQVEMFMIALPSDWPDR